MKAIHLHIIGIRKVFDSLMSGKYLLFFIPGIIVGILFWQSLLLADSLKSNLEFIQSIPLIGTFLQSGINSAFGFFDFLLKQLFVFFILTLLSPFNALLAEKIDSDENQQEHAFDLVKLINDLLRMIFLVTIITVLEGLFIAVYWIISRFITAEWLNNTVFFLISAFFYGFSFYDYSLERDNKGVFSSLVYANRNMLTVTLTGICFLAMYSIHYIGVVVAPVIATMLATYIFITKEREVQTD